MKGSGTLVASVVAASTVALSSSASSPSTSDSLGFASTLGTSNAAACNSHASSSDKGKFAPRFDGLRFIETLVTAHR